MSADKLYTAEMLAAAVDLANYPAFPDADRHGHARAPTCGSTIAMDLALTHDGEIARVGMLVHACAVGQAAASIFADNAAGRSPEQIGTAKEQISAWLAGHGTMPDWPGLALIAAACDYPARHGAIMLPWNAALAALSTAPATR